MYDTMCMCILCIGDGPGKNIQGEEHWPVSQ